MLKHKKALLGMSTLIVCLASATSACAGGAKFDLNSDPSASFTLNGNAEWFGSGGSSGGVTDGYLRITAAVDSQRSAILFPDFDKGLIVKAFTFSMDVRTGDGEGDRCADGFSINYARSNDPIIAGIENGGTGPFAGESDNGGAGLDLPEEGTTTGIGIGFDTWSGNGPSDIEGISVRVDGKQVAQFPLPTRHGSVTDPTSLQTGARDLDSPGSGKNLGWAKLKVELTEAGALNVWWKGGQLLTNYATTFFPSAGRIVFGGRTGGENEIAEIDNIEVTTVAASTFLVSSVVMTGDGVKTVITDTPGSVFDPASLVLKVDGTNIPNSDITITKSGSESIVTYKPKTLFVSGSMHKVDITAKDGAGNAAVAARDVTTEVYSFVAATKAIPSDTVNKTILGFKAKVNQMEVARTPGDANSSENAERQIQGRYPYPNLADVSQASGGIFNITGIINFEQEAIATGNFSANSTPVYDDQMIPGIPGTTGSTDFIAAEFVAFIELKAGMHRFGVNSDDGFKVTVGPKYRDLFAPAIGLFNAGRGSSDTLFDLYAETDGLYPFRLLWWEGDGGANVEFFAVENGKNVPINAPTSTYKAYSESTFAMPAYVESVIPAINATGVVPDTDITAVLVDNVTAVDAASIKIALNGKDQTVTTSKSATKTTAKAANTGLLSPRSVNTVTIVYADNGTPKIVTTNAYTFTVADYVTLSEQIASPLGSGSDRGFKVKVQQINPIGTGTPTGTATFTHFAEQQFAGMFGPNIADLISATAGIFKLDVINWNQDAPTQAGNFGDEIPVPGIPGATASTDNIAAEVVGYVEFPAAGAYTMGVNSDDGFRVIPAETVARYPLKIEEPASIGYLGALSAGPESTGAAAPMPTRGAIKARIVYAQPAIADIDLTNAAAMKGNIALIDRGTVSFADKIARAYKAGAVGVIMVNNRDEASAEGVLPIVMGSVTTTNIPAVMISMPDGAKIKAALTASTNVVASLGFDPTPTLGEFNGGRGATDTTFSVYVPVAGLYPMRMLWYEGGGGANCEWFTIEKNGTRILLNDPNNASALKVYRSRTYTAPVALTNIVKAGDTIVPSSSNSPAGEQAPKVIDGLTTTKYLNFDKLNTGFTVTPSVGQSIIRGIALVSANDAEPRDPASFVIAGSNDGTTFTFVADGLVNWFPTRFFRQEFYFQNNKAYNMYRVTFPTVLNAASANSMQVAEVELLGNATGVGPVKAPQLSVKLEAGKAVITFEGTLQSSDTANGTYTDISGTSPLSVSPSGMKFYRAKR